MIITALLMDFKMAVQPAVGLNGMVLSIIVQRQQMHALSSRLNLLAVRTHSRFLHKEQELSVKWALLQNLCKLHRMV